MSISLAGEANVRAALRSTDRMIAEDILRYHPEIQSQLDDIMKQGWQYLYIETVATALAEVNIEKTRFRINPNASRSIEARSLPENVLELDIGTQLPAIIGIPEVEIFRVNVCSKSFPRAATVNLANGVITYIHDVFWKWQKGWETDEKKVSDAREVREVAAWLLDVKKYKLQEDLKIEHYQELSEIFRALPVPPSIGKKEKKK